MQTQQWEMKEFSHGRQEIELEMNQTEKLEWNTIEHKWKVKISKHSQQCNGSELNKIWKESLEIAAGFIVLFTVKDVTNTNKDATWND